MRPKYKQGVFIPQNPEKYRGDHTKIKYRSSYELEVFGYLDRKESVLEWSAETVIIPYYDPVKAKKRRYIVDVWMKYISKNNETVTALVEVKATRHTTPPKATPRKKKSTLIEEQTTWATNQAKWKAAQKYAYDRGWKWFILTEKEIFG